MDAESQQLIGEIVRRTESDLIRVPRANPDLTDAAAKAAMDRILAAGAVRTKNGPITAKIKSVLQQVAVTNYDVK